MNVLQAIGNFVIHVSEAATRLFSSTDDDYPVTGVQPFTGEPYSQWVEGIDTRK
ncbi:isochorismate synthase [Phormidium tenue FACHB-886]|nr:isochorismate synthase [Phormidium tenue FACHB-886]